MQTKNKRGASKKRKEKKRRKKLVANGRSRFEVIIIERFLFAVCNHDHVHFNANLMYLFHVSLNIILLGLCVAPRPNSLPWLVPYVEVSSTRLFKEFRWRPEDWI